MKKSVVLPFFLFSFCIGNAQRVTYSDLKYVLYHNIAQTEDYLSNKGFSFGGIDTLSADGKGKEYIFTKNPANSNNYISVEKIADNDKFFEASFFTILQSDYLSFKSSIKKIGFVAQPSQMHDDDLILEYRKGKLLVSIWIKRVKEMDYTEYDISLKDDDLEYIARSN